MSDCLMRKRWERTLAVTTACYGILICREPHMSGTAPRAAHQAPEGTAFEGSLTIRKLIFRNDALDLVRPDAVPEPSIRLDGHALNDGVDLWCLNLDAPLRPLPAMTDGFVDLINMCHFSIPLGSLSYERTRRAIHPAHPQRGFDTVRDATDATNLYDVFPDGALARSPV